jgi:arsenate reductase
MQIVNENKEITGMITIYHNPRCSKSRETLSLLKAQGIEPTVVQYLDEPLDKKALSSLLKKLSLTARDIVRTGEDVYKSLGLKDPNISEDELLNAIVNHPKLMQRPIVVNGNKAALGRPPENVLEIL